MIYFILKKKNKKNKNEKQEEQEESFLIPFTPNIFVSHLNLNTLKSQIPNP
jgi:hypothetical protein